MDAAVRNTEVGELVGEHAQTLAFSLDFPDRSPELIFSEVGITDSGSCVLVPKVRSRESISEFTTFMNEASLTEELMSSRCEVLTP